MSERTGIAHRLWSIEDIAEYASYGLTMARKVASQPDFPSPIRIFDRAHPRWVAGEVMDFFEARKAA